MADTKAKKPQRPRTSRKRRKKRGALPFILVCAVLIIALSFLFRVSEIEVVGSTSYTDEEVISASNIQLGDNLFFINSSTANSRIASKLPSIDSVAVNRIMPNKIQIVIEESTTIAYVIIEGQYWSLDRSVRFLEQSTETAVANKIEIRGLSAISPIIGTKADGDKADTLTEIFSIVAGYGMTSSVQWIDMTESDTFEFSYEDRFIVKMSVSDDMDYDFRKLLSAVSELSANDRATLDLSIDEKVHFTPR